MKIIFKQKKMSFIKEWIYRLRHNRGFGVQSPAAFHFVMHVLRECKHPYYCYTKLNKESCKAGGFSAAHTRRLFRISNYVSPGSIITFADEKGCAQVALSAGCTRAVLHSVNNVEELHNALLDIERIGLLHIGNTPHYAQVLTMAMPHIDKNSVIIVEGVHTRKDIAEWWRETIALPNVIVSMDLYSAGILFFDTEYKKQHYTFWFR